MLILYIYLPVFQAGFNIYTLICIIYIYIYVYIICIFIYIYIHIFTYMCIYINICWIDFLIDGVFFIPKSFQQIKVKNRHHALQKFY